MVYRTQAMGKPTQDRRANALAAGAGWMAIAGWIEQALTFLFFIALARAIGVDALGAASMAFAFVYLGEFLVRETLTEGVISAKSEDPDLLDATFRMLLLFGVAVMLCLIAIAPVVAFFYRNPEIAALTAAAAPTSLIIAATGVHAALLRRRLAFRALAVRAVAGCLAGGIAGVAVALSGGGAWAFVAQRLTQVGVNGALAVGAARWRPRPGFMQAKAQVARGLGGQVVLIRALTLAIGQTPIVALGVVAGPRSVALFAFAWRMVEVVLLLISNPLKRAAQPALAALRRTGEADPRFMLALTEVAAFIGFAAFAGLALVAAPLIEFTMGPDWAQAAPLVAMLALAGAVLSISEIQEAVLLAVDQAAGLLRALAIEAAIGLALVVILCRLGPEWVAAGVAARAFVCAPMRIRAALEAENVSANAFFVALTRPALVAAAMAAIVMLVAFVAPSVTWLRLAALVLAGVAVFAVAMVALRGRVRQLHEALSHRKSVSSLN
jgi:PST family polysaccharide transporter